MSLEVDGTLRVDGPHGPMVVRGRGRRVEVQVTRLRSVPSLLRRFFLRSGTPTVLDRVSARTLTQADVDVRIGTGRWQPFRLVAAEGHSAHEPALRIRFRPFSFSSPPSGGV